jgi:hypothetical protein
VELHLCPPPCLHGVDREYFTVFTQIFLNGSGKPQKLAMVPIFKTYNQNQHKYACVCFYFSIYLPLPDDCRPVSGENVLSSW